MRRVLFGSEEGMVWMVRGVWGVGVLGGMWGMVSVCCGKLFGGGIESNIII